MGDQPGELGSGGGGEIGHQLVIAYPVDAATLGSGAAARYLCRAGSGDRHMSYKDLLVVLDSETASRRRMDLAAALAERFVAHLVGRHPPPLPEAPRHFGYYAPALLEPFFHEL